jgi:hypothetical protein
VITDFVQTFLEEDPEYFQLSHKDRDVTFGIYKTVMRAVMRVVEYDNVLPILLASDSPSANLLQEALNKIKPIIPQVSDIKIRIIN